MYKLIAVVGPTASGKTRRAVSLAKRLDGEIISADSRQVYRGMTIGTGKDLDEYGDIPYHIIDIHPAGYKYNLHQYLQDFHAAFTDILSRRKFPVVCGGTGLYVENALSGISLPEVPVNSELRNSLAGKSLDELTEILSRYKSLHNTTDTDTCKRAIRAIEIEEYYLRNPEAYHNSRRDKASPLKALIIGVDIDRELRREKIRERLKARLREGMIEEVKGLLKEVGDPELLLYYGLEYKFVTHYLLGNLSREDMEDKLLIAIRQFAKRQMTWFRGMEKRGFKIHWLPAEMTDEDFNAEVLALLG